MFNDEQFLNLWEQYEAVESFEQRLISRNKVAIEDIEQLFKKAPLVKDRLHVALESYTLAPSKTNLKVSLEAAQDMKGFILVAIAALIGTLGTRIFFWLRAFIRKRRDLKEGGGKDMDISEFMEKAKKIVQANTRGNSNLTRSFEPKMIEAAQNAFDGLYGSLTGLDEAYVNDSGLFKEIIGYANEYPKFLDDVNEMLKAAIDALRRLESGNRADLTKALEKSDKIRFGGDTLPIFRSKMSDINSKLTGLKEKKYTTPIRVDKFLDETSAKKLMDMKYDATALDKKISEIEKSLERFKEREKLLAALSGDEGTQRIVRNVPRKELSDVRKDVRTLLTNIQLMITSSRDVAMTVFNTTQTVQNTIQKIRRQLTTHVVRAVAAFGKEHSKEHNMGVEISMLVSTMSRETREGRGDV